MCIREYSQCFLLLIFKDEGFYYISSTDFITALIPVLKCSKVRKYFGEPIYIASNPTRCNKVIPQ